MTKKELALEYWDRTPTPDMHSATNWLRRQINQTRGLKEALFETGYSIYSRKLTPVQVAIIYKFIGPP